MRSEATPNGAGRSLQGARRVRDPSRKPHRPPRGPAARVRNAVEHTGGHTARAPGGMAAKEPRTFCSERLAFGLSADDDVGLQLRET
jgi:hypothetical protein